MLFRSPAFSAAPALFGSVITVFDELTDAVKPVSEEMGEKLTPALEGFADIIETRVAPFAGEAVGKLGDIVLALTDKALDPGTWEKFGDIFTTIKDVVAEMWPSIESLAGSFLTITQNISVATWQILGSTLEAIAPLFESVLVPLVEKVAEFAENNPGVVHRQDDADKGLVCALHTGWLLSLDWSAPRGRRSFDYDLSHRSLRRRPGPAGGAAAPLRRLFCPARHRLFRGLL